MKLIASLVFSLFISGSFCSAEARVIIAIRSRDIAPYNMALQGFTDYLKTRQIDVRIRQCVLQGKTQEDLLNIREEIESIRPTLVLALGSPAAKVAQEAADHIRVISTMVLDPKASNTAPPGVSMDIPLEIKLRHLTKVLPGAKRIAVVYSKNSTSAREELSLANGRLGFQVIGKKIDSGKALSSAFEDLCWQADCFLMIPDSNIYFPKSIEYLLTEALRKKIPVIGLSSSYTKAGALISFDCDYEALGEQAAEMAVKTLHGDDPGSTEFVKPKKISFSLNLLAAERLGIKLSSEVIKEAREVFGK